MTKLSNVAMVEGLPAKDYFAAEGWNKSLLSHGIVSSRALKFACDSRSDSDSAAMRQGRAVHAALAGTFADDFAVFTDHGTRASKAYKEFAATADTREILTNGEHQAVLAMVNAVQQHPVGKKLLVMGGLRESSWFAVDPKTGLKLKARPDLFIRPDIVVDFKTARVVSRDNFQAQVFNYDYYLSVALTLRVIELVSGIRPATYHFLAIQSEPPYDVVDYRADKVVEQLGEVVLDGILRRIKRAQSSGKWPGISGRVERLTIAPWAEKRLIEEFAYDRGPADDRGSAGGAVAEDCEFSGQELVDSEAFSGEAC